MNISQYFVDDGDAVYFEETRASEFARSVAGDFNPIHDPGSKRFCVPGDLLFSVLLHRYGAARETQVKFSGMLDGNTRMLLPSEATAEMNITDDRERALLSVWQNGSRFLNTHFISALSEQYVRFSGQTFPGILVPLMEQAGVMINPARPLVIYKDMAIKFNDAATALFEPKGSDEFHDLKSDLGGSLSLELSDSDISVNGRKGLVRLQFNIDAMGEQIGTGEKNMLLSGLREFDADAMQAVVDEYNTRINDHKG